jgi:hypothetical protein
MLAASREVPRHPSAPQRASADGRCRSPHSRPHSCPGRRSDPGRALRVGGQRETEREGKLLKGDADRATRLAMVYRADGKTAAMAAERDGSGSARYSHLVGILGNSWVGGGVEWKQLFK